MRIFYEWYHDSGWLKCGKADGYEIQEVGEIDTYDTDFTMSYRVDSGITLGLCCGVDPNLRWYIDSIESEYYVILDAADLMRFRSAVEARLIEEVLDGQNR